MRDSFYSALYSLFTEDDRIVFITGDLGFKLFDRMKAHDPRRVLNVGVREAAMIGFAAGLARSGWIPVVYSIVPFLTLRCLEQIKIDLCYNRNRVVLAGAGGGYAYGPNGPTHHGVDDIGALSGLPGMTLWTPADPSETAQFVREIPHLDGPAYLRLGRAGEKTLPAAPGPLTDPGCHGESADGWIVTFGTLAAEALEAQRLLLSQGIRAGVVRLRVMRPFPQQQLSTLMLPSGKPVLSVEEHVASGGLGFQLANLIAGSGSPVRFRMLTAPDSFPEACYGRTALLRRAGIDAEAIAVQFRSLCHG